MIIVPQHGLVFLAMTKCASTAIEDELYDDGHIVTKGNPRLKHMTYRGFKRHFVPLLRRHGFPRTSYEVVSMFREPIEWLHSWYRYRARDELARATGPRQRNYSGNVSFDQFAQAYIDQSEPYATGIGRQANFVRSPSETVGVDRVFRYDEMPVFVDYLSEKLGRPMHLQALNVSTRTQKLRVSRDMRDALRAHLATEYYIYETHADGRPIEHPKKATTTTGTVGDAVGGNGTATDASTDDARPAGDAAADKQPVQTEA